MRLTEKWKPDFIVAILAVTIGVLTMFVYIYQARVMSRQLHASVWPYIEVVFSQGAQGISVEIANKGVGPAMIKKHRVVYDGVEFPERKIDSLLVAMVGRKINRNLTTVESRVMAPGEKINFILINEMRDMLALDSALKHHRISVSVCYCSIYDECWKVVGGKNESCGSCD
ncbi:MAG TPA: hypothetical protein PLX35_06240 [Cyclobacteriaceae bacterium]|nr:hypothetical protein [Cyclobacteriaceae bacterium]